jgi:Ion channel
VAGVTEEEADEPTEPDVEVDGELEQAVDAHLPAYRYGIVLGLLFVTFIVMASGPTGEWVPFVTVVLQGATLLAALAASGVSPRLWRIAVIIVVIALASGLTVWTSGVDSGGGTLFVLNALLVAGAPLVIAIALVRRRVIDIQTVLGALCIYVLLGMLWAFMFAAIGGIGSEPFFAQTSTGTVADFLYFSFVTLTTTGYGDLTAASGLGRAVAVLEALLGQLYLVTIVAVIVSRMGRIERRPRHSK